MLKKPLVPSFRYSKRHEELLDNDCILYTLLPAQVSNLLGITCLHCKWKELRSRGVEGGEDIQHVEGAGFLLTA